MRVPDALEEMVAATRARVRFRYPWWLRPFLMRGVAAITLGRRIYMAPDLPREKLERFLAHELVHVRQVARLGLVRFYWLYLSEFIALRRSGMTTSEAYRNISFEIEAAAAEEPYNQPIRPQR